MNPTDLKFNIIPIVVGAIGLIVALVLGVFIGGSELSKLGIIVGLVLFVALLGGMRQHIWLLVPIFWGFTGSVSILPLPFSVRDLVVMLCTALGFALLALRVFKFRNSWGLLDLILLLNLGQVFIVFLSNPVGLRALSSETVGARPYFNIAIATLAYLILSNQVISRKLTRSLPIFLVIPEVFLSVVGFATRMKPSLGFSLGMLYSDFLPAITRASANVERVSGTVALGRGLIIALCSYFRPLSLLNPFRPGRVLLFIIGIILVLVSGFRSQLIGVAAIFLIASYLRKGFTDTLVALAAMFMGAIFLALINSFYPLPLGVQRTLSSLPGQWDAVAAEDAAGSTQWRLQMWKDIPQSSRYIRNRLMGDGFGFSRAELKAMERQQYRTGDMSQEDFMLIGAFHNGPLSAIRFVGVVGMLLYYTLLIYTGVYGWRLIRASEGSAFYPLAMFVSLAFIWEPVNYTFIFGAYDSGLPNAIFGVGMLKMVHNSLRFGAQKTKAEVRSGSVSLVKKEEPVLL